jgi:hypothetical protein
MVNGRFPAEIRLILWAQYQFALLKKGKPARNTGLGGPPRDIVIFGKAIGGT